VFYYKRVTGILYKPIRQIKWLWLVWLEEWNYCGNRWTLDYKSISL